MPSRLHRPLTACLASLLLLCLLLLSLAPSGSGGSSSKSSKSSKAKKSSNSKPDPCSKVAAEVNATGGASAPSRVAACMDQFKFDESRDLPVLDTVRKALDAFYPYRSLIVNPPDPVNFPAMPDIVASLAALALRAAKRFKTARSFHEAISRTVRTLNDGHTVFSSKCFETFLHVLALPVVAVVEQGALKLRVVPLTMFPERLIRFSSAAPFYFNPTPYAWAEVVTIDKSPALRVVQSYADALAGGYHNLGSRFNQALARRVYTSRSGNRTDLFLGAFNQRVLNPATDSAQFTVVRAGVGRPVKVQVPWISMLTGSPGNFTNMTTYWETYCGTPNGSGSGDEGGADNSSSSGSGSVAEDGGGSSRSSSRAVSARGAAIGDAGSGLDGFGTGSQAPAGGQASTWSAGRTQPDTDSEAQLQEEAARPFDPSFDWQFPGDSIAPAPATGRLGGGAVGPAAATPASAQLRTTGPTTSTRRGADTLPLAATVLSSPSDFWQVFLLRDNMTTVIALTRFDGGTEIEWRFQTTKALQLAAQYGSRVLIDVRGNGGGLTVHAWWLAQQLLGSVCVPRAQFRTPMDFRVSSPLITELMHQNISWYNWRRRADLQQNAIPPSVASQVYYPLRFLNWGGGPTGLHSALFKSTAWIEEPASPQLGGRPFAVVSDGACFSACAIFTQNLKLRYNVTHITVGGVPGQPLAISNSCLGFTMKDLQENMLGVVASTNVTLAADSRLPRPFSTYRATFTLALASGYINSSVPCEFVFLPGDARINFTATNIDNPAAVWEEAVQYIPASPPACAANQGQA